MIIAYFLSHPVQYQSPLLQRFAEEGFLITTVYSDISPANPYYNPDYSQKIAWEKNILDDYKHVVIQCPHLGNWILPWIPKIRLWLNENQPDAVWIHGWGTSYSQAALVAAYSLKIPILLRGETHLNSRRGNFIWKTFHHFVLKKIFKHIDQFLAIGTANKILYNHYGVPSKKIALVPYVADNATFNSPSNKVKIAYFTRSGLNIPEKSVVILYTGRFSKEKGLFDLLRAFKQIVLRFPELNEIHLVLAGAGPLKNKLQSWVAKNLTGKVTFTGFLTQAQLPSVYSLCDIFVLPSHLEPWGMVVNEVMNAGKPIVLSDRVGAGNDLLEPGVNGYSYRAGDIEHLIKVLLKLVKNPAFLKSAGARSREIISNWDLNLAVKGMHTVVQNLKHNRSNNESKRKFIQPKSTGGVVLAYAGLHEIFQMAQAANENGILEQLYCSLFDGPGKLGRPLSRLTSIPSATALGAESLPVEKVQEIPLPLLSRQIVEKIYGKNKLDPLIANIWFEKLAARELHKNPHGRIAVGSETCSLHWFKAAKEYDMACILDCHGIPAPFLDASLKKAVTEFNLPDIRTSDSDVMARHKEQEREIADIIVFCSELQRDIMVELGVPESKTRVTPLWVDTEFWHTGKFRPPLETKLKVVYAGTATLPKGLPYLLKAADAMGSAIELSLVGWISPQIRQMICLMKFPPKVIGQLDKHKLRDFFHTQHILILPSLGDSFGFVAMEAMACGLPVIITTNCGAPVPDKSWRIPSHNSDALIERMYFYLSKPDRLEIDSIIARKFAEKFPPSAYRIKIAAIYRELLN